MTSRLATLTIWQRYIVSFLIGAGSALALAPVYAIPLLFITFPAFLLLIETAEKKRRAFAMGWWFGLGFFVAGLYWVSFSLLVDIKAFIWVLPFSVFLLPAFLALYTGAIALVMKLFNQKGFTNILLFTCLWTIAELIRGHIMWQGFPWNLLGYVWTVSEISIQSASIFGAYGLSFITLLIVCMPYLWVKDEKRGLGYSIFAAVLLVSLLAFGYFRIDDEKIKGSSVSVRVVQANIPVYHGWDPQERLESLRQHIELSQRNLPKGTKLVVWPEASIPFNLEQEPHLRMLVSDAVPRGGYLIAGGTRYEETGASFKVWNSLYVLNQDGDIVATYDKQKLVPFGEFVPFKDIVPFIKKMTYGAVDFSRGPGRMTIGLDGVPPFSPLICYEVIYPDDVRLPEKPAWLLNVTNDAWFRQTSGPYQHFQAARMRAVEEGVPLLRAANTGVSGMFNSAGQVIVKTNLFSQGIIDGTLRLHYYNTVYNMYGNRLVLAMILICLTIVGVNRYKKQVT